MSRIRKERGPSPVPAIRSRLTHKPRSPLVYTLLSRYKSRRKREGADPILPAEGCRVASKQSRHGRQALLYMFLVAGMKGLAGMESYNDLRTRFRPRFPLSAKRLQLAEMRGPAHHRASASRSPASVGEWCQLDIEAPNVLGTGWAPADQARGTHQDVEVARSPVGPPVAIAVLTNSRRHLSAPHLPPIGQAPV
jgi:hypothetical protein